MFFSIRTAWGHFRRAAKKKIPLQKCIRTPTPEGNKKKKIKHLKKTEYDQTNIRNRPQMAPRRPLFGLRERLGGLWRARWTPRSSKIRFRRPPGAKNKLWTTPGRARRTPSHTSGVKLTGASGRGVTPVGGGLGESKLRLDGGSSEAKAKAKRLAKPTRSATAAAEPA